MPSCRPSGDPSCHNPTIWKRIDQDLIPITREDGSTVRVLRGWVHGHQHLQRFVDALADGTAEAPSFLNAETGLYEPAHWYSINEFEFIAEHGFVRLYERRCRNAAKATCSEQGIGWRQWCSHWDPTDPAHPRFAEF